MRHTFSLFLSLALLTYHSLPAQNFCVSESEGGVNDIEFGIDIDADPAGNVFVTGAYKDACDFGGFSYFSLGLSDLFLAKYNNSGSLAWIQHMGGSGPDRGNRVFFGPDANVYLCGNIKIGLEPGGPESLHAKDGMFARYDSSGNNIWLDVIDGNNYSESYGITATAGGNTIGAGIYNTQAWFSNDTITTIGNDDIFVVAYGPFGTELWHQSFGSKLKDGSPAVGVDANDNVYLTGYFQDTLIAAGDTLISAGGKEVFVIRMNATGVPQWAISIPGSGDDFPTSISVNAAGDFVVSGNFAGNLTLGTTYNAVMADDGFVAKYNNAGQLTWAKIISGDNYDQVVDIDEDMDGNYYFGGYSYGTIHIGTDSVTNGGYEDIFMASVDAAGNVRYLDAIQAANTQFAFGVAADPGGNFYMTGSYFDQLTLGGNTMNAVNNGEDIFWAKYGEAPSLILDSVSGPPHCINDAFAVWFTARGCYDPGNTFTVQLSDATGSFSSPENLGIVTAQYGGSLVCNVPGTITGGTGYRVRVIANSPSLTSNDNGSDIELSMISSSPPAITGDSLICAGDTITLDAGSGYVSYLWNNSETTQVISITSPGLYSVEVADSGGCTGYAEQFVDLCISNIDPSPFTDLRFFPNPATSWIQIESEANVNAVTITDLLGRIVFSANEMNCRQCELDLSSIPAGSYIAKISTSSGEAVKRMQMIKP
jgi:Secretion system C-terminal sorting domain